jgi:hypothetical protein
VLPCRPVLEVAEGEGGGRFRVVPGEGGGKPYAAGSFVGTAASPGGQGQG